MKVNLTKGSIIKNLLVFSVPYFLSSFLQTFYGMADLFIVGRYNEADAITAVSVGSQVMHMLTVIILGLAMGGSVLISQGIGENDRYKQGKGIGNTIILFVIVAAVITVLLLILVRPITRVMMTPEESVSGTESYLTICFAGIPFIVAYNIISAVFRGLGDSKRPCIFVAISCVFNIFLDFLFIGYFDMGPAGAAYGTVISQGISVLSAGIYIMKKGIGIKPVKEDFVPDKGIMKSILKVGVPVALQDGLIQISFVVITIIVNRRGVDAAAGVGIVEKIISFLFLVPSAMLSSVSAVAAQNNGAGEHERARKTLYTAIFISVIYGFICVIICHISPENIISLFTDEEKVITLGAQYLSSYSFDCIFAGIHFCFSGYFCAYNKSLLSFIHNITSIALIRIPGAYAASVMWQDNLFPMGLAAPLGSLLSAVICVFMYRNIKNNIKNK